jgi:hypothetical protein
VVHVQDDYLHVVHMRNLEGQPSDFYTHRSGKMLQSERQWTGPVPDRRVLKEEARAGGGGGPGLGGANTRGGGGATAGGGNPTRSDGGGIAVPDEACGDVGGDGEDGGCGGES